MSTRRIGDPKDIWIFAEVVGRELREVTLEMASEGRRLADKLRERLCSVVLTGDPKEVGEHLSQYGTDAIYYTKTGDGLDAYTHVLSHLIRKYNPRLMLMGAGPIGSEIAPRIAARNEIRVITNCVVVELSDSGFLGVTKMILGNKVYATFETPISKTQIITVVPGSFGLRNLHLRKPTELFVESVEMNPSPARMDYIEFIRGDPKRIDISEAEIVIAVGRGVGDHEGLKKIEQLAELLKGALAGSRVAVDRGWIPFERQVGQTGKTISPRLLICCGVSGAFEFTAGIKDSRLIVGINKDPEAPIFRVSDLSLIGDLHAVVGEIIQQLEKRLEEKIR